MYNIQNYTISRRCNLGQLEKFNESTCGTKSISFRVNNNN